MGQIRRLKKQLAGMPDPVFRPSSQLVGLYNSALDEISNPSGLTTQEDDAYLNDIASGQQTAYRRGTEVSGGNNSAALNYALNSGNLFGFNNRARINQQRKSTNLNWATNARAQAANQFQNLKNQNTQLYLRKMEEMGRALRDRRMNRNAMYGQLIGLGTTAAGFALGGPAGAAIGGQLGNAAKGMISPQAQPTQSMIPQSPGGMPSGMMQYDGQVPPIDPTVPIG